MEGGGERRVGEGEKIGMKGSQCGRRREKEEAERKKGLKRGGGWRKREG